MVKPDTNINPIWESEKYYLYARKLILETNDRGLSVLKKYAGKAKRVLDIGCGEGSRLKRVLGKKIGYGVDVSERAIKMAKKKYPGNIFYKISPNIIPFSDNYFDLVYSAYVLEHIQSPEIFITEAERVLKKQGILILISPNYGSPNRASPVYRGSRLVKLVKGITNDLFKGDFKAGVNWNKVTPEDNIKKYDKDFDTTIEPYLGSLMYYLESNGFNILEHSSVWEDEQKGAKIHQRIFRIFSSLNIYPFIFWGPKIIIVARKSN